MSAADLLTLSLRPLLLRIRLFRMERRLALHYRELDFFRWQTRNGTAGMQDAHKRIAFLEADITQLRRRL